MPLTNQIAEFLGQLYLNQEKWSPSARYFGKVTCDFKNLGKLEL